MLGSRQFLSAILLLAAALLGCVVPSAAFAEELLSNRSFESPVAPNDGHNVYATIPNWSVVAQGGTGSPFNIVKPYSGYCCNQAMTTPTGGGIQYLDISGTWGRIRQSVTLSRAGTVRFSGWFSTRDGVAALTGSLMELKNSAGTTLATVTVDFTSSDTPGSWKQGQSETLWLAAGTYYFEAYIPNEANFDLASVYLQSELSLGSAVSMTQCPVTPLYTPGSMAGWTSNSPAGTMTQDGYYDSNWALKFWNPDGVGTDLTRLAGQASNLGYGPGVIGGSSGTVQAIKPVNGSWANSVPTLAAAISTGSYVQINFTTANTYNASRLALANFANHYLPGGAYQHAAYISTSSTFNSYTELYRDRAASTNSVNPTVAPLLAKGTTYYIRIYIYNVTSTYFGDGSILWDDWHMFAGDCSSLNPTADTGTAIAGTPKTVVSNITSNDMVNGWSATLGASGNATISMQGTWPSGVLLDSNTGAVSIDTASASGTYTLTYRLCDKGPTPVCGDNTVTLTMLPHLSVNKTGFVLSDPVNGTTNPKAIPGAIVRYCIVVANPTGNPSATNVTLSDQLPTPDVSFLSGTLKINSTLASPDCDYSSGSAGGTYASGNIQASLPDLAGGAYAGLYYNVVVQ